MENFIIGALFGVFGTAYFFYGRKRKNSTVMYTGVALCVYPYFIDSMTLLIVIGVALSLLPFVYKG